MPYWSLCWKLQNLGGIEKPESSLADRTDGRLEMTWALVLLKCSLLWGWKEHKTETVNVSVQGLLMWCEHSIKGLGLVWNPDLYASPAMLAGCGPPEVGGEEPVARPHPLLGRQVAEPGGVPYSSPPGLQVRRRWSGGGGGRERVLALGTTLFVPETSSSGERTWSNSLIASTSRSCLWRSCGSVSVSSARGGWVSREQCRMTRRGNQRRTTEKLLMWVWSFISCALVEKKVYLVKMLLNFFFFFTSKSRCIIRRLLVFLY